MWNLFNNDNVLFGRNIIYSMHNSDTTISENVKYFINKYNIVYDDYDIKIFLIYLTHLIIIFKILHSWMIFV